MAADEVKISSLAWSNAQQFQAAALPQAGQVNASSEQLNRTLANKQLPFIFTIFLEPWSPAAPLCCCLLLARRLPGTVFQGANTSGLCSCGTRPGLSISAPLSAADT